MSSLALCQVTRCHRGLTVPPLCPSSVHPSSPVCFFFFLFQGAFRVPLVHVVFLFGVQCFPPFKANQNQLEQEDPVAPLKEAASLSLSLSLPPSLTIPLSLFLSLLLSPLCLRVQAVQCLHSLHPG